MTVDDPGSSSIIQEDSWWEAHGYSDAVWYSQVEGDSAAFVSYAKRQYVYYKANPNQYRVDESSNYHLAPPLPPFRVTAAERYAWEITETFWVPGAEETGASITLALVGGTLAVLGYIGAEHGPYGAANGGGQALGDLTPDEIEQIQAIVDEAGQPLWVVGSAAEGRRRNVGTGLPIGKGTNTRSDIDYWYDFSRGDWPRFSGLPDMDFHGVLGLWVKNRLGPGILFQPGQPPQYNP